MAYIQALATRTNLFRRKYHYPSFCSLLHNDDRNRDDSAASQTGRSNLIQQRGYASGFHNSSLSGFCPNKTWEVGFASAGLGGGPYHPRHMSTTAAAVGGGGSDKVEVISDVADVVLSSDAAVRAMADQVPVVNEVAVAAADSFFPVAALQHFIDAIHNFTGFEWWASIVVATLMIRTATIPLAVNQLKSTSKLSLMRPRLEEIKEEMQAKGMDPMAVAEGQQRMKKLFQEYGVSPITPFKGLFIQGPIFVSFFLAISNMVAKVPSFKTGGAFWFVDLTTPDSLYILPVMTALTFLITVEYNMQEGLEGNPVAGTMKKVMRVFAVLTVPLTMGFPKGVLCYWMTSNFFSLVYGIVLKIPGVKKFLGVPDIPVPPASTAPQSSFNLFSAVKQAAQERQQPASSLPIEPPSKLSGQRLYSSSDVSKRLSSLEKQVKRRNKKRR